MFSITALYAIFITNFVKNENVKKEIIKKASFLGILSILISIPFLYLYLKSLPSHSKEIYSLLVTKGLKTGFIIPLIALFLYFVLNIFTQFLSKFIPSLLMTVILFSGIFAGERIREILRKPYIIPGFMYSNCIIGFDHKAKGVESDISKLEGKGILEIYPFTPSELKNIDENNIVKAGKLIALLECSSCHSLDNGVRPLKALIKRMGLEDAESIMEFLDLMGENYLYMPYFIGNENEKRALALYLISLKGR